MIKTILIAMAGEGKRFQDENFSDPKPLIQIDNTEMFVRATKCLPESENYAFITKQDFENQYRIKQIINKRFKKSEVILIDKTTEGQVSTCLLSEEKIDQNESLLIGSCDSEVIWNQKNYSNLLANGNFDAIIWTFRNNATVSRNPNMYGWVGTKNNHTADFISCKKSISENPVSDHAIVGIFWFKSANIFFNYGKELIKKDIRINNEFYIDEMMNLLIKDGLKVGIFEVDKYICWGTPDDLRTYNYWKQFFKEDYEIH